MHSETSKLIHYCSNVQLISGQRLCPWKKKRSSVSVFIHTYGITHDCGQMKEATVSFNNAMKYSSMCIRLHEWSISISQHDKVLWPHWEKGQHNIKKTIFMPELVAILDEMTSPKSMSLYLLARAVLSLCSCRSRQEAVWTELHPSRQSTTR